MAEDRLEVILALDTHADTHTVGGHRRAGPGARHADDRHHTGGVRAPGALGSQPRRPASRRVGGTGAYGAGVARFLTAQGVTVIEVDRPNRQRRRKRGKSDPTDAEAAARSVLAGEATTTPKARVGIVESIRVLRVARKGALKARTQAGNQLKRPRPHRPRRPASPAAPLSTKQRAARAARFRVHTSADPAAATKRAMRHIARRYQALSDEIGQLDHDLAALVGAAAPRILARPGVGVDVAGQLLVTAGDNAERLRSEASLAALCGASPVEASSGKITRHRLNRGGDRHANNALWANNSAAS